METRTPATLWTLLGTCVLSALIAVMLGASTARTETNEAKALVCTMSTFFSFHHDEVIGETVRISGRGLLTCNNDDGFATEEPVIADLEAKIHGQVPEGEIALSGNTSAFVIPRSGEIQDLYRPRDFAWTSRALDKERTLVFRGVANDLVIEMNLTSPRSPMINLEIQNLRLHYDDAAPDLNGY